MPGTPIIPDSKVVLVPLEAHLRIVVLRDEVEEVREEEVGFVFCDAIDTFGEAFVYVDGFPAGYRWVWALVNFRVVTRTTTKRECSG